jgi:hypothetical protein
MIRLIIYRMSSRNQNALNVCDQTSAYVLFDWFLSHIISSQPLWKMYSRYMRHIPSIRFLSYTGVLYHINSLESVNRHVYERRVLFRYVKLPGAWTVRYIFLCTTFSCISVCSTQISQTGPYSGPLVSRTYYDEAYQQQCYLFGRSTFRFFSGRPTNLAEVTLFLLSLPSTVLSKYLIRNI